MTSPKQTLPLLSAALSKLNPLANCKIGIFPKKKSNKWLLTFLAMQVCGLGPTKEKSKKVHGKGKAKQ